MTLQNPALSRRAFVKSSVAASGGLMLALSLPKANAGLDPWTGEPSGTEISAWLTIDPNSQVTIRVAQSEMGEGVFTAMPMLVAEELDCDWSQVKAEYARANRSVRENGVYKRMGTGGSGAVRRSREYLQQAGASARERLKAAAAARWEVPVAELRTEGGEVFHDASGRRTAYGVLAAEAAAITLAEEPAIRKAGEFKLLGTPLNRLDVPSKVDGSATFGIDVKVPGMVYAAYDACPVWGGTLAALDEAPALAVKGVKKVIRVEDGFAVIADSYWRARKGLEALSPQWDLGPNAGASSDAMRAEFKGDLDRRGVVAHEEGDAYASLEGAETVIEADYDAPYLAHLAMEPVNCTVSIAKDRVDVWTGTQNPESVLGAAAEILGRAPETIHVHNCFLGGGFGRRSMPDFARRALAIAKALGNTPVKVLWSREADTRTGHFRPLAALRFKAGFDADGKPVALLNRSATHSILAGFRPEVVQNGLDGSSTEGLENQPYDIANVSIEHHLKRTPVPVWFWRSVGSSQNGFALEAFIDEMAEAAGQDPLAFRQALLHKHPAMLKTLNLAAEKANWGRPMAPGSAQGIAIHESFGSICAQVAEVTVTQSGEVKVERVVTAIDCGNTVNPRTIAEQVESSVIYGLSAALWGRSDIENGQVVQQNFDRNRVVKMVEAPAVETHFSLSGGEHWGGIGEPALPPTAPAVVNAIYKITGRRIRALPIAQHDLSWS